MSRLHTTMIALVAALSCAAASAASAAAASAPAAAAPTPATGAGLLVAAAENCEEQSMAQVFLPWLDVANYVLAPGGAAESASGWSLVGGASIAPGNEPHRVHAPQDDSSLRMPGGSVATTDVMCVGIEHPTLRVFTRADNASLLFSRLTVEVDFEDRFGHVRTLPVALIAPGHRWSLSPVYPIAASLLPLLPGERTPVRFRLRAHGPGTWQVDDLYVDPWRSR